MSKILVAYFSASGVTANASKALASAFDADLFEIRPKVPYTSADLNWMDKNSRSSVEMRDKSSRPEIAAPCSNLADYDTIFLAFPIWWYVAPTIVHTFLEKYNFSDKKIILFATSGGSGFGNTMRELQPSVPNSVIEEGRIFNYTTRQQIIKWVETL